MLSQIIASDVTPAAACRGLDELSGLMTGVTREIGRGRRAAARDLAAAGAAVLQRVDPALARQGVGPAQRSGMLARVATLCAALDRRDLPAAADAARALQAAVGAVSAGPRRARWRPDPIAALDLAPAWRPVA